MGAALAKPDVSLVEHSLEVLEQGDLLCHYLGITGEMRARALLACALHDIGKAIAEFQRAIRRDNQGEFSPTSEFPHALASFAIVLPIETHLNQYTFKSGDVFCASLAVLTHHSPFTPMLYRTYGGAKPRYMEEEIRETLAHVWPPLNRLVGGFLPDPDEWWEKVRRAFRIEPIRLLDAEEGRLRRLLHAFRPVPDFADVKAVLVTADWVVSGNRGRSRSVFLWGGHTRIQSSLEAKGRILRDFQRMCAQIGRPGRSSRDILALAAPTGTGKTEALLLYAGDSSRILYLLPTRATANAMWRRLRSIYGEGATGIAHASATYVLRRWMRETYREREDIDDEVRDRRLFGRAFALPVVVATLDQFLLAGLHARHWELRQAYARRAAVVIDELGAYDAYTFGLLCQLLEHCRPAKVAVASATLPRALLRFLPGGSGNVRKVLAEDWLWDRSRHRVAMEQANLTALVERVARDARDRRAVLVVANTVRRAVELYRQIADVLGGKTVTLLHSRFTERDRAAKEAQILTPEPGTVLVATQVVEVSLDISYDVLYTELCPVDALVQRLGRVNRYAERPRAPATIALEFDDGTARVYNHHVLRVSQQLLHTVPDCPSDRDWFELNEKFYDELVQTEAWKEEFQKGVEALQRVTRDLGTYTIDLGDEEQRELFRTRPGAMNVNVLPEDFLQEALEAKETKQWDVVAEVQVPVPVYWLLQFPDCFYFHEDLRCVVTRLPYSAETGIGFPGTDYTTDAAIIE